MSEKTIGSMLAAALAAFAVICLCFGVYEIKTSKQVITKVINPMEEKQ